MREEETWHQYLERTDQDAIGAEAEIRRMNMTREELEAGDRALGIPMYPGHTRTEINSPQVCDFCANSQPAVVDGKTTLGHWAGMCGTHVKEYGLGLGTGYGHRLVRGVRNPISL